MNNTISLYPVDTCPDCDHRNNDAPGVGCIEECRSCGRVRKGAAPDFSAWDAEEVDAAYDELVGYRPIAEDGLDLRGARDLLAAAWEEY